MNAMVHELARCDSRNVGADTRIWAFAHVLAGARIGANCNICDHVFIENDVVIGDRVTVKCGVQLWDGMRVANDVFIGPNATFCNDPFPRSRQRPARFAETHIECGASIGANATILPGLRIGRHAMVGAGAVVTHSVPPHAIVVGNPARIVGYAGDARSPTPETDGDAAVPRWVGETPTHVDGVTLHRLNHVEDLRGSLCAVEFARDIPFEVKRCFTVFGVPSIETRGEHAHRRCHQFLVCVHGACSVVADDGTHRQEFRLDAPDIGIHLPPMVWGIQYKYSDDAVLLVLASAPYDSDDYVRDYATFLDLLHGKRGS